MGSEFAAEARADLVGRKAKLGWVLVQGFLADGATVRVPAGKE